MLFSKCFFYFLSLLLILMNSSESDVINPTNVITFINTIGKLKHIKRTGWVRNNIILPESVSDHMYKMTMMVFMIRDCTVDKDKLMKRKYLEFY